ncbi:MAG: chemotaxis protein CheA [Luteibaculum sp.]
MGSKEEEYKEMFLAEALDNYEELNRLFTQLEKDIHNKKVVDHIFRITHTLKGNAMGMGFEAIAELAHVMEDIFSEVKSGKIELEDDLFNSLFKANDKLGELIDAIKTDAKVSYKGIRTKLAVYLKNALNEAGESTQESPAQTPAGEAQKDETKDLAGAEVLDSESSPNNGNQIETQNTAEENSESPAPTTTAPTGEEEQEHLTVPISVDMESGHAEELGHEQHHEEEEIEEIPNETKIAFSDLVQVPVRKLDSLLNLVGELIIERDSLIAASVERGYGTNQFARLLRITSDLQYGVMDVRLVQVGFLFNKFHRIIRDVASIEKKKVDLILEGTENEIDRNILKIMSDSLVHVIRNSVSHGIEKPEERIKRGKPERGQVILRARNEKDTVIIEIIDDGNGIDASAIGRKAVKKGIITEDFFKKATRDDLIMLIFEPGFSNAESITEVSGRGVGMDVVKRATESIGGSIRVLTEVGKGSTFQLSLPSSMAVKGALLFELNQQEYAVALSYTEAVISLYKKDIHKISNGLMASYLGKTISIIFLNDLYQVKDLSEDSMEGILHRSYDVLDEERKLDVLVTSYQNKYVGFVVDKLLQQKEIVEKTLAPPIDRVGLISGATILGNGNVCLVLDIANIINQLFKEKTLA